MNMSKRDFFIQTIHIKNVRNIIDFIIPLDNEKRQHLIITGKNGSGKTSLLLGATSKFPQITTYFS